MREKDVGMSHKESPLAAQWLTKSLAGNRGGRLMNRDRNIPTWFCGQKRNVPGERGHLLFTTQCCLSFTCKGTCLGKSIQTSAGGPCARQKFAYKRRGTLQNSSKIFKNASSAFGVTMIGWWPLFIPVHSACSLIPTLCVVRSVGMHWVKSSREAKASRSKGRLRVSITSKGQPGCREASRTMA